MNPSFDKFGAFFVQNLRDRMLGNMEMLLRGDCKAPEIQKLQSQLSGFTDKQKQVLRDMVEELITTGMHDLLFAIHEDADAGGGVKVLIDGQEVAKLSDGLHGEIFGDDGWIVRYSKYPSEKERQRSLWAREQIQRMFRERGEEKG